MQYTAQDALQVDTNILDQVCATNDSHFAILQAQERPFYKPNTGQSQGISVFPVSERKKSCSSPFYPKP